MPKTLTRVLSALAMAGVVILVAPAAALACGGGGTSAQQIYTECVPSASGGHSVGSHGSGGSPSSKPSQASSPVAKALLHSNVPQSEKNALQNLATNPGLSSARTLAAVPIGSIAAPSTLGAALDSGAGPIALIAVLAATAALLLAATGWRGWRRWRA